MKPIQYLISIVWILSFYHSIAQTKVDSLLDVYFSISNSDRPKAMQIAQLALEAARVGDDRHSEAVALECIGVQHYYRGDYQNATKFLKEAEILYRNEDSNRGLSSVYNNMGLIEQDLGNYPRAISYFSYAMVNDEAAHDMSSKSLTLGNLGTVYLYKGQYSRAKNYFHQALLMGQKTGNSEAIGNALNNLGLVHLDVHRFDSALIFFRKAKALSRAQNDNYGLAIACINSALALAGMSHTDSAAYYFNEALPIIESLGDPDLEIEYLIHASDLDLQMKDYSMALQKLLSAQKINNRLEQKKKSAEIFRRMGIALARYQNPLHALEYLRLSQRIAMTHGLMPELAATYEELSLAFGQNNDYDSAKFYMEKFAELKAYMFGPAADTLTNINMASQKNMQRPRTFAIFLKIGLSLTLFWILMLVIPRWVRKSKKA